MTKATGREGGRVGGKEFWNLKPYSEGHTSFNRVLLILSNSSFPCHSNTQDYVGLIQNTLEGEQNVSPELFFGRNP